MFATSQGGDINLVDLKVNKTTKLVTMTDVKDVSPPTCYGCGGTLTYALEPQYTIAVVKLGPVV